MKEQPSADQRRKVHIVKWIASPLWALCGNRYADRFESDNIRRVTCRSCRRLARKHK